MSETYTSSHLGCEKCHTYKRKSEKLHRDMQKREGAMMQGMSRAHAKAQEFNRGEAYGLRRVIDDLNRTRLHYHLPQFPPVTIVVLVAIAVWGWCV